MKEFSKAYDFPHISSSSHYPQSNGQTEQVVQTVKRLLKRSEDLLFSVMNNNATLMPWCLSELLIGKKMQSTLSQLIENLIPK